MPFISRLGAHRSTWTLLLPDRTAVWFLLCRWRFFSFFWEQGTEMSHVVNNAKNREYSKESQRNIDKWICWQTYISTSNKSRRLKKKKKLTLFICFLEIQLLSQSRRLDATTQPQMHRLFGETLWWDTPLIKGFRKKKKKKPA